MAGLLDFLNGTNASATPWPIALSAPYSALYPSPLLGQMQTAMGQAPDASTAAAYGAMGIDPSSIAMPTPPASPFPQQPEQPKMPGVGDFGKGAMPFGFAGPGSLGAAPSVLGPAAPGAPAPVPAVAQVPDAAPTDANSANRSQAPDNYIPVGDYQMPTFAGRGVVPDAPTDLSSVNRGAAAAVAPVAPGAVNAAPVPAVAPSAAPAPFSLAGAGSGAGDRLMKATRGFVGNMQTGPVGALVGGLGALITGQETDPSAIARQQANASAQALISKGASPAEAAAAIHNPALMTALIQQYYGKDKWSVVKTGKDEAGNETYMQQNQVDGTLRPLPASATGGGAGVSNTITGPDGKVIQIPPGVDRKTFIKRISETSADAATGKSTEAQAKASSFAARMQQAEGVLGGLQNQGLSLGNKVAGEIPIAGNYMQSTDYQRYKQAASAFITAMLRQESGAAINKSEFDRYEKEMFPQPGDDASVVQQKAAMRSAAISQMSRAAGPGYQAPAPGGTVNVGGQTVNWSVK